MTNVRQRHGSVPDLGGDPSGEDPGITDSDSDSGSDQAGFKSSIYKYNTWANINT